MTPTPITKADLSNAKTGCYECELLEREIDRMEKLGLDVAELQLRLTHLRQFFQALLDLYGPLVLSNRPS